MSVDPGRPAGLRGRVALVTGAGGGIGRAMAVELARRGADVVALDIVEEAARETAAAVQAAGRRGRAVRCDLGEAGELEPSVSTVLDFFGRLDILCNNAALPQHDGILAVDWQEWARVLEVNITAPARLSQLSIPYLAAAGGGSIVNVASVAGLVAGAGGVAYTTSKHALIGLTRAMALDLAPLGIRVNALCPGAVRTTMTESFAVDDSIPASKQLLPRWAAPEELARAVAFLADTEESGFMTGSILTVDGGWTTT